MKPFKADQMKYKVLKKCINQDTKAVMRPGEVVSALSDFERGRHLAEGNIETVTESAPTNPPPVPDRKIETADVKPPEKRRDGSSSGRPEKTKTRRPRRVRKKKASVVEPNMTGRGPVVFER